MSQHDEYTTEFM